MLWMGLHCRGYDEPMAGRAETQAHDRLPATRNTCDLHRSICTCARERPHDTLTQCALSSPHLDPMLSS